MNDPILEAIRTERLRTCVGHKPRYSVGALFGELHARMGEALAYRLDARLVPDDDEAIRHVGTPFAGMVSTLLRARGIAWDGPMEMYTRAIGTGDVPALLEVAGNRALRASYASYSSGLLHLCGRVLSRDLRDVRAIQLDGDMALKELKEGGEYTEGALKASADTYPVSTFGRMFTLTRTLFSDDDLAAFANLNTQLGRMAAEFVAGKVASALESTATLSDGVAPFATAHANLGTAGALSETTVGQLLALVRNQVGLGGERIAAVPRALVVPSVLELTANKIVAVMGNPRPLEIVVEPRLSSTTAHYVLADPASLAALSYTGSDGPTIEVSGRPEFVGLRARVRLDFGAGWSDFRGASKNLGQ